MPNLSGSAQQDFPSVIIWKLSSKLSSKITLPPGHLEVVAFLNIIE